MKNLIPLTAIAALVVSGISSAQTPAYSAPIGYSTVACPVNSDTIVGMPLRQAPDLSGALTGAPVSPGDQAVLTIGAFTGAYANTHYVKFSSGPDSGKILPVVSNTTTTLTVDLNGGSLASVQGDALEVIKFWTLGELFNPSQATTDAATTGNAVVASLNALASGRRTLLLLPDQMSPGINIAPNQSFFIVGGEWRELGVAGNKDLIQLWPDTYFIIRQPSNISQATSYVATGQVELGEVTVPLTTQTSSFQDNFIAISRPVDVPLDQLGLKDTPAFVSSTNTLASGRRDVLLVFDNSSTAINKAPAATYFVFNGQWRKLGSGGDAGEDLILAGNGFIIRKFATATGETVFWKNSRSYLND